MISCAWCGGDYNDDDMDPSICSTCGLPYCDTCIDRCVSCGIFVCEDCDMKCEVCASCICSEECATISYRYCDCCRQNEVGPFFLCESCDVDDVESHDCMVCTRNYRRAIRHYNNTIVRHVFFYAFVNLLWRPGRGTCYTRHMEHLKRYVSR